MRLRSYLDLWEGGRERMTDRWAKSRKLFRTNELFIFNDSSHHETGYLLALDTSQGSLIVLPATNLKVSERDIKLGSTARGVCGVTVSKRKKNNQFRRYFTWTRKHRKVCRKSIRTRMVNKFSLLFAFSQAFFLSWNFRNLASYMLFLSCDLNSQWDRIYTVLQVESSVIAWMESKMKQFEPRTPFAARK